MKLLTSLYIFIGSANDQNAYFTWNLFTNEVQNIHSQNNVHSIEPNKRKTGYHVGFAWLKLDQVVIKTNLF